MQFISWTNDQLAAFNQTYVQNLFIFGWKSKPETYFENQMMKNPHSIWTAPDFSFRDNIK